MKIINKILFIGPLMPPVHGQSMAFTRLIENIDNSRIVINTNLENKNKVGKIFFTIKTLFNITIKSIFTKYDVVYFTCSRSFLGSIKDILLINLVTIRKVKLINHLHGSDFGDFLHNSSKWYKKVLFYSYNKVDISIVLLDSMKSQFKDFKNMDIEVVSNFYDKELDKKLIEKDHNIIKLVYLSNIMKSKGIFELLDAFEYLSIKYKNISLTIAGGFIADEYMSIEKVKEVFENKISKNNKIKYIGKVFSIDKVKLLQSSDIFVLPSYYKSEAFPISIIEAMACENAIVTTNYKYLPEVVSDKNGVLVEPKIVDSLVNGIESLLSDDAKLQIIQKYNKKEAKEKYSLNKYIKSLNKIILGK